MTAGQPTAEPPRPVSRLWEIIRESVDANDPERLFSDDTVADAGAVLSLADGQTTGFPAKHVLGWFYWLRYLALDEPADQEELASAATYLAVVHEADPQAVPADLRDLLDGRGDLSQRGALAALLLRRGRSSADLTPLTAGLSLLGQAIGTTPAGDPRLPAMRSNLAAGYVELYHRTNDESALDAAIEAGRQAYSAGDEEDPPLAALVNLAAALLCRYERSGDPADLAECVTLGRAAAARVPAGDPAYSSCLSQLGNALRFRYWRSGDDVDLEQAIAASRAAFAATAPDDAQYGAYAASLASSLIARFEHLEEPAALTEAIGVLRDALAAVPEDHPQWARHAANLSNALRLHYERGGAAGSFDEQMDLARRAAAAAREENPSAPHLLSILANSLRSRYDRTGDDDALREAVAVSRRGLALTGPDEPHRQTLLGNYGSALWAWYERSGDPAALREATDVLREVATTGTVGDAERAAHLNNLATALQSQYERSGDTRLLEEAADAARTAAGLAREGTWRRATHLSVLGNILLSHYEALSDTEYLEAAEQAFRLAVTTLPAGHADRGSFYCNLANALMERHERRGDDAVLDEAITILRQAVTAAPEGHPERTTYLSNLAISLFARYQRGHEAAALDEAISLSRRALQAMPDGHPDRGRVLSNLSYYLRLRHDGHDLDDAVVAARQAVRSVSGDHPYRCTFLVNLGAALRARHQHQHRGDDADLAAATGAFRAAARVRTAPPATRLVAARSWGDQAARGHDWRQAAAGFRVAMDLLAQVAPRRLARVDQERQLAAANGLASDAAACALNAADAALAVRWLEQGRGLLLAQALETRTELTDLRAAAPALADRFERLREALDVSPGEPRMGGPASLTMAPLTIAGLPGAAATFAVERRRDLVADYERTVREIRDLPGFTAFLNPPATADLLAEAAAGPIVMVNASQYRCDALALTAGGIIVIPLQDLTAEDVTRAASAYLRLIGRARRFPELPAGDQADAAETLRQLLGWLWEKIAGPVLETLGYEHGQDLPPRLWWCPAGLLGLLPLHAAQRYDSSLARDTGVIDRVVSSYTPTIRALKSARSVPGPTGRDALVISMPDTPGQTPLPSANREAAAVAAQLRGRATVLRAGEATREAVKLQLRRHAWLHFTGHSAQHLPDPGRAALLLADGELTLLDIARLRLSTAEFAFLSSCEGGLGSTRLPDEAIHLAGALQIAGYRDVIAALWSIRDNAAVAIAEDIYRGLAEPGEGGTALALHGTLHRIRARHPPLIWAAYCHTGP